MIELGLQRIARLLVNTKYPSFQAIHVAGTNGKGTICAYISGMLDAYNASQYREAERLPVIKHGRFTSPHLIDRRDCVTVNELPGWEWDFDATERRVLSRNEERSIGASEFEIMTATAFEAFAEFKVDLAVIEVGMGGRLDATNVLAQSLDGLIGEPQNSHVEDSRSGPLVTAIAKVGMDHQGFLGNTIEEIAREKAGIIKPGAPVVYDYSNQASVRAIVERTALEMRSPLLHWVTLGLGHVKFPRVLLAKDEYLPLMPNLVRDVPGLSSVPEHTQRNFSVAFRSTWSALRSLSYVPLVLHDGPNGLQELVDEMAAVPFHTVVPGRQETVDISTLTGGAHFALLDGAHNAQSAEVLGRRIDELRSQNTQPITWVLAASDSKDVAEVLHPLLKADDSVFAVEFGPVDSMPWAKPLSTSKLLAAAGKVAPRLCIAKDCGKDVLGALRAACVHSDQNVVIAGSLYLVGDVHRLLRAARHG